MLSSQETLFRTIGYSKSDPGSRVHGVQFDWESGSRVGCDMPLLCRAARRSPFLLHSRSGAIAYFPPPLGDTQSVGFSLVATDLLSGVLENGAISRKFYVQSVAGLRALPHMEIVWSAKTYDN